MSNQDRSQAIEYYVALDLGSESMAAYCQRRNSPEGQMINLLEHASSFIGPGKIPVQLIEDGDQPSPRMRTLICLEDARQPLPLPAEHARLDLLNPTERAKSLFSYFHEKGAGIHNVMPNPKIPFQYGSSGIIPRVLDDNKAEVAHAPEQLLQHITSQVVENFLLKSSMLRSVDRSSIHLTLTVPNVYSLTHAESIRGFVEQNLQPPLGQVEFLFESDALAYTSLAVTAKDDPQLVRLWKRILNRKDQQRLRIATIDIGRGTTDLSIVEMQVSTSTGPGEHYVLARTGNCDGGNSLSWLFVEHYNMRLAEAFEGRAQLPWDFVQAPKQWILDQHRANGKLQTLIEQIKRGMTNGYRITVSKDEQRVHLDGILSEILSAIDTNWRSNEDLKNLCNDAIEHLLVPDRLPAPPFFWWKRDRDPFIALRMRIQDHIKERVVSLLGQLREVGAAREGNDDSHRTRAIEKRIFDHRNTFALVGGQASQFAPLMKALKLALHQLLPENSICFLHGKLAKEACCRGAVKFQISQNERMNPEELFGTYAFMAAVPQGPREMFAAVDMRELKSAGTCTLDSLRKTTYWFVYSPGVRFLNNAPQFFDGTTAMLCEHTPRDGRFVVDYKPSSTLLTINGHPVSLATYGSINESIFPKIWPEVCKQTGG